jgi:hypothetical protein
MKKAKKCNRPKVKLDPNDNFREEKQVTVICWLNYNIKARILPTTCLICNQTGKRSKLLYTENIAIYPDWHRLKSGERILTLGAIPDHRYTSYIGISEIAESKEVTDGMEGMQRILDSLQIILRKQRKILDLSAEIKDEGTNAQMSDYISQQEKLVWMFSAYLK